MKYVEIFAGIGGMGWGLMQAGMECVGYVEWDKYAHKAFQILHDPEDKLWNAYDVRDVTNEEIDKMGKERGPINLVAFGFPCQSFSIAGKRKGFEDTRGTLFFEACRFVDVLKPEWILAENVTGLLSHDNGETFRVILESLNELGYEVDFQVLNTKDFGIPQNRERIFLLGRRRKIAT